MYFAQVCCIAHRLQLCLKKPVEKCRPSRKPLKSLLRPFLPPKSQSRSVMSSIRSSGKVFFPGALLAGTPTSRWQNEELSSTGPTQAFHPNTTPPIGRRAFLRNLLVSWSTSSRHVKSYRSLISLRFVLWFPSYISSEKPSGYYDFLECTCDFECVGDLVMSLIIEKNMFFLHLLIVNQFC